MIICGEVLFYDARQETIKDKIFENYREAKQIRIFCSDNECAILKAPNQKCAEKNKNRQKDGCSKRDTDEGQIVKVTFRS